jgi:hypothetical protein
MRHWLRRSPWRALGALRTWAREPAQIKPLRINRFH